MHIPFAVKEPEDPPSHGSARPLDAGARELQPVQSEEHATLPTQAGEGQGHVEPLVPHHRLEEVAYQPGVWGVGLLGEGLASLVHTALHLQHVISVMAEMSSYSCALKG